MRTGIGGDLGFYILLRCSRDEELKQVCEELASLYLDSNPALRSSTGTFDMGEAAGQFTYTEDPDGTYRIG